MDPKKGVLILGLLALLLLAVGSASLFLGGAYGADPFSLSREGLSLERQHDLFRVRLSRVLIAAVAGGALGACGVVLQALLRNPLAYPHILGISGGAAVGGIAAQLFGFATLTVGGIHLPGGPLAAFLTALAATFLIYRAALVGGKLDPVSLILVGVVFNTFAAALILFFFSISDQREARGVLYWMIGSLEEIDLNLIWWVAGITAVGCLALARTAPALNVLCQGEEVSASLGVPVARLRLTAFLWTSVVVGAVVSACGMIGFVGLIIPHLFRLLLGPDHRVLFPASLLGGAVFLMAADFLARNLLYPEQIPVGVFTAFCGGPFFLFLLRRVHRGRYFHP